MNLKEYENWVLLKMSQDSMANKTSQLGTAGLGLAGEAGEFADICKKILFQGKEFDEETRIKFIKELGDIMFYLAFAAKVVCNSSIEEVIENNIKKLNERYKKGFTVKESLERIDC